jgi:hypothetical protein
MAQPVFPTLSTDPDEEGFVKEPKETPTFTSEHLDGSMVVGAHKTVVPYIWSYVYRQLSDTDRDTLMAFWEDDANFGAIVIKWTDPTDSTAYFVRFRAKPSCRLERDGQATWRVQVQLEQAIGTYT